jgi:hypothetical protein
VRRKPGRCAAGSSGELAIAGFRPTQVSR